MKVLQAGKMHEKFVSTIVLETPEDGNELDASPDKFGCRQTYQSTWLDREILDLKQLLKTCHVQNFANIHRGIIQL